ncbi:MAG: OPT/YSL family transporter [Acidobacteriota bacterium]
MTEARAGRLMLEEYRVTEAPASHPSLLEASALAFGALLGLLGAVIGLELLTRVGIAPNTSVIGAVIAIAVSRIPLAVCRNYRSLDRQNLMQTVISAATFGSANALLLPLGVIWLFGAPHLVPAMFAGALAGMITDAAVLYRVFDTKVYPAGGTWPPGVATAECLIAGDRGGKRAGLLGVGAAAGGIGRLFGLPMDIVGVCWIGNIWALTMFSLGLLATGYAERITGMQIQSIYLPHGVMIGAGAVAILEIIRVIVRKSGGAAAENHCTRSERDLGLALGSGLAAFVLIAVGLALLAGLYTDMSPGMLVAFVLFSAVAAMASELIVGISAMHAGWFPAFATALIFLVLGMALGFPPLALAFLVGYTASTGPAFADMGYDLKTGWIVRGSGRFRNFEMQGRRQQFFAALLGFGVAAVVVLFSYERYFSQNLFPPVDSVFVATIRSAADPQIAGYLLMWAVPGAMIQWLGGPSRQLGILLATGLLIDNPVAGWTALLALAIRVALLRRYGKAAESPMYVLAGGLIAGSAVTSFGAATLQLRPRG